MKEEKKKYKILFSPVSNTDPIAFGRDGSMLHICRKYKPDYVYIYLTKEMKKFEDGEDGKAGDKRFTKAIEKFNEENGTKIEYIKVDSKVEKVHDFDLFYKELQDVLNGIKDDFLKEEKEIDVIYLNVTSGTPQMKSALYVLGALDEKGWYKSLQVTTPNKSSNYKKNDNTSKNSDEYDFVDRWNTNEDNNRKEWKDEDWRVVPASSYDFLTKIKKEIIKKHIQQYDYNAAYELAKTISNNKSEYSLSDKALKAIEAAKERIALNYREYAKDLIESGVTSPKFMLDKYKDNKEDIKLYEYILSLDIKRKRKEYADFIRAISPILRDIFILYILEYLNLDIYKYCYPSNKKNINSPKKLSRENLEKEIKKGDKNAEKILNELDNKFVKKDKQGNIKSKYKDTILAAANLSIVIKALDKNKDIKEKVSILRNLESEVRNIAAHQVVAINNEQIKKASNGKDAEQIVKMIQDIAELAGIVPNDNNAYPSYEKDKENSKKYTSYWDSYEAMNEYIIDLIGE